MENDQGLKTILRGLTACDYQRDFVSIRNFIYEILNLSTNGANIKPALPVVVKFLSHPDAFIKRVAGEIVSINCEENEDIALLGINTLVQDCKDVNPVVRGISFRTLGALKSSAVVDVLNKSIIQGLSDKHGYVRRSAALASINLHKLLATAVTEGEIWDLLYHHLRDDDPTTVAVCLCALEEVCADDKGIVMSNKLGLHLINNMHTFTPTGQRMVVQFLLKFSPKSKDQMFDSLNLLDDNLTKAHNFAMTFCSYELFLRFTQDIPRATKKVHSSAWSSVKTNLARERSEEIVSTAIHYLNSVDFNMENCCDDFNKFVCRDDDSHYLTHHKINILTRMITPDNVDKIFSEYLSCVRTMSMNGVKFLIQNVSEIFNAKPDVRKSCVDFLKNLMATEKSEIINEVMQILPTLNVDDDDQWKDILSRVEEQSHRLTSLEAKTALLQMIKTHTSKMEDPAQILEDLFLDIESHPNSFGNSSKVKVKEKKNYNGHSSYSNQLFKLHLLGALVQTFLLQPALVQPILSNHMESCIKDSDQTIRDKALLYYGFLFNREKQEIKEFEMLN